ncbi:hypothetical protein [Streptomyces sp. STCH 565 A]|uniref:hypothetical protein n=1 Tax=Streptomyces sp. STCH 565 A TaxID=2950532 RepID=UPI0020757B60|nr:hypothetical protein [Streptomyces sp. STCH 565 A]MCM8548898.1 hypothetical protein [Streptomyces sp. STCH 565 A]
MPAYLITHTESRRGDVLIEDPHLTLTLTDRWARLSDQDGYVLAVPAEQVASITRIDQQDEKPHEE